MQTSRELQKSLEPDWREEEIFRIDHYLGKEMVKNLLILRFGNEFFGATWNRNHIDNVQVCFPSGHNWIGRTQTEDAREYRLHSRSLLEQKAVEDISTTLVLFVTSCRTVSFPMQDGRLAVLTHYIDLLQVLTIIGMERPISFSAEDIRDEKVS